ncbi:unnamed protein product [Amoebophrya sp. A25]|nr:unnamed protein product [Amoebophrya sp. A25]|eukprot:GSA25T00010225001.1
MREHQLSNTRSRTSSPRVETSSSKEPKKEALAARKDDHRQGRGSPKDAETRKVLQEHADDVARYGTTKTLEELLSIESPELNELARNILTNVDSNNASPDDLMGAFYSIRFNLPWTAENGRPFVSKTGPMRTEYVEKLAKTLRTIKKATSREAYWQKVRGLINVLDARHAGSFGKEDIAKFAPLKKSPMFTDDARYTVNFPAFFNTKAKDIFESDLGIENQSVGHKYKDIHSKLKGAKKALLGDAANTSDQRKPVVEIKYLDEITFGFFKPDQPLDERNSKTAVMSIGSDEVGLLVALDVLQPFEYLLEPDSSQPERPGPGVVDPQP